MLKTINITLFWAFLLLPLTIPGQEDVPQADDPQKSFFNYLVKQKINRIKLSTEIDTMVAKKMQAGEFEGYISFIDTLGVSHTLSADFEVRGKFRRKNCQFPPINIDLKKGQLLALGLSDYDSYKLVTHCSEGRSSEDVLNKEYIAYKIYNLLTPESFRVHLLEIEYNDLSGNYSTIKKAFFIESNKELEDRLEGEYCECLGQSPDSIDAFKYELMSMFHYMIGNRDVDLLVLHNIKLLRPKNGGLMTVVAWDFDFSKFVYAPYAHSSTDPNYRLARIYLGYPQNRHVLPEVIQVFKSKEERINEYIKNYEDLSNSARVDALRYLRSFYKEIERREGNMEYIYLN